MSRALDSVRNGDMGVNEAARTYDVPRATLQRRLKVTNCFAVEHKKIIGSTGDLVSRVIKLEEFLFGITPRELRVLALEIAQKESNSTPLKSREKNSWQEVVLFLYEKTS